MRFIALIPSRYASTRFPGKALALIQGIPMIQRVYQRVHSTKGLHRVFVATDDVRIARVIEEAGGDVIMTSPDHKSGTSRCCEAMETLIAGGFMSIEDIVINIQGDEPDIDPAQIQLVMECFSKKEINIATLVKKIEREEELFDENVVKVVVDQKQKALLFSRQTIPFIRGQQKSTWLRHFPFLKHVGIYGYRSDTLAQLAGLDPSMLDKVESLEQLTWIENGYEIFTRLTEIDSTGVDVPEDLRKFESLT